MERHVSMSACMHVCMYACMHVCMYACMHVYDYSVDFEETFGVIERQVNTHVRICVCVVFVWVTDAYVSYIRTYIHTLKWREALSTGAKVNLVFQHTYIHTHTYIQTYIHTHIHTYIHTYVADARSSQHRCESKFGISTSIHTHTYTHTYIHIYIHTYVADARSSQHRRESKFGISAGVYMCM